MVVRCRRAPFLLAVLVLVVSVGPATAQDTAVTAVPADSVVTAPAAPAAEPEGIPAANFTIVAAAGDTGEKD